MSALRPGVRPREGQLDVRLVVEESRATVRRLVGGYPLWAPAVALSLLAAAVISPRFAISGPSLIDDWNAVTTGPRIAHELVHHELPAGIRYYPAWILWNYLQWRGPLMVWPNVLDVLRVAVAVSGITLVTWLLCARAGSSWLRAGLAALPALLVLSAPTFAIDLARFGPQEPLLVGGMLAGGSLLWIAALELQHGRRVQAVAAAVPGALLWIVGVYMKETSICALILVPFAIAAGLPKLRRVEAWLLSAVLLLPLLHVAYETLRIVERGKLQYGGHASTNPHVALDAFLRINGDIHSKLGTVVIDLAVVLLAVRAVRRDVDVFAVGLVVVGAANLQMSMATGQYPSRYYLATFVLAALVVARSLSRLPTMAGLVAVAAAGAVALHSFGGSHAAVSGWAQADENGVELAQTVHRLRSFGCTVRVAGLDEERTLAVAALGAAHLVVDRCTSSYLVAGSGAERRGCDTVIERWLIAELRRCVSGATGGSTGKRPARTPSIPVRSPLLRAHS